MSKLIIIIICFLIMTAVVYCDNGVVNPVNQTPSPLTTVEITSNPTHIIPTAQPTPETKTTYQVENKTGVTLEDAITYYWNGESLIDDVFHDDLVNNAITNKVETNHDRINIGFKLLGSICIVTDDFNIMPETNNIFTVEGTTHISCDD